MLRDAGDYLTALPKEEFAMPNWQVAASCLLARWEALPFHDGAAQFCKR
jgi:hypothetical protein